MKSEPGSDSGCTAVVALLKDDQLWVANAGDSRCIVCRNENDDKDIIEYIKTHIPHIAVSCTELKVKSGQYRSFKACRQTLAHRYLTVTSGQSTSWLKVS
ncbi:hypothetical protein WA026_017289 [Henosepilachna vigintioctopunctata]|uniref:PPM-type phosphatase domain-containing protein n=1 Tax=Henosepilachna vigintioctopunctata TaxID=420089 RepID=A0AAW1UDP2_9CUCU